MLDYVGKPFTSQELWRVLLKYLRNMNCPDAAGIPIKAVCGKQSITTRSKNADEKITEYIDDNIDSALQKKLKITFAKNNQGRFDEIASAVKSGDIKLAHRLAHTLKGNAGQIGESNLQNAAAKVESLLKQML